MSEPPISLEAIKALTASEIQADPASEEEQSEIFAKASQAEELEQARLKNETLRLENEGLNLKNANLILENNTRKDNNDARKDFKEKIFSLTVVWLLLVIVIIICVGVGWLKLGEKVLIALITSGSVNVLAFFLNVTKYLYHNDK